jgi:archaellum component FlaC
MPFAVEEFRDLVRLLEERPEWRADLRRLVLTTELLAMPEQLAALRAETERAFQRMAEAQARTDEQLARLSTRVESLTEAQARTDERLAALTEAQKRTDERLDTLAQRVAGLAETQARMADQLATLSQRMEEMTEQMGKLMRTVGVIIDDVGELKGRNLEADYRTKGHAYFSRLIRRPHVLSSDEIVGIVEDACDRRILSDVQAQEIYDADVIVRGKRRTDGVEVYLIVEVSWGVGPHDVERAVERAALFARTGATTIPVVAGKKITAPAVRMAQAQQVWQVTNGSVKAPEAV